MRSLFEKKIACLISFGSPFKGSSPFHLFSSPFPQRMGQTDILFFLLHLGIAQKLRSSFEGSPHPIPVSFLYIIYVIQCSDCEVFLFFCFLTDDLSIYLFSSLNFILGINRPQYSEGFGQTCIQAIDILCW